MRTGFHLAIEVSFQLLGVGGELAIFVGIAGDALSRLVDLARESIDPILLGLDSKEGDLRCKLLPAAG